MMPQRWDRARSVGRRTVDALALSLILAAMGFVEHQSVPKHLLMSTIMRFISFEYHLSAVVAEMVVSTPTLLDVELS